MSLFTIRMFIPDALPANPDFGSDGDTFGPSYGNRVASERWFRESWQPRRSIPPADKCCDSTCA